MAWSTRELAELAGTTVNTIRHYHRIGILAEPARLSNGYKQYEAADLARVITIRRLGELGIPLTRVDDLGSSEDGLETVLRVVDAELAAGIDRLQRARADVAVMLEHRSSPDVPAGFSSVAGGLSDADKSLVTIYSQFLDQSALDDIRSMIDSEPPDRELARLADDADDDERQQLAERTAPTLAQHFRDYPWLKAGSERRTHSSAAADRAMSESLHGLYSPAQVDVLRRAIALALDPTDPAS
ncbi:MerR family transcriptional regulator [Dietzia psychralcaliphila]|uniref:MerR family transcriptional regulator n=1 Tax=Dietzia psychralcaliphila TaxID=139021 RepID=UPI001C1E02D8|nr:MerR family transcriptional regulator [Dietzia psychralcaliphila]